MSNDDIKGQIPNNNDDTVTSIHWLIPRVRRQRCF